MSESSRQRRRKRRRVSASRKTQSRVVGTVAAAAVAGVSRRTLGRRASAGELVAERDSRGRLVFAVDALADVELRPAGRPRTTADSTLATIVELRATGMSFREIAAKLELDHVPPPGGGDRWWASGVRNLLHHAAGA
jgi:hypothetical protein